MREIAQSDLAQKIGLSYQMVQKYESGKSRIAASMLYRIAEVLNVCVDEFFVNFRRDRSDAETAVKISEVRYQNMPYLKDSEVSALVNSFTKITDRKQRESVIDLLKAVCRK